MAEILDWQSMKEMSARLLKERSGEDLDTWNRRVAELNPRDEQHLRAWAAGQGITGYAQSLLVWERFGYPEFMRASASELVDSQYADRPQLRPILDAILTAALGMGEVTIQARKTYISLVTPRRTFARVQATTRDRVDLALRIEGLQPDGRLVPSKVHESMPLQLSFSSPAELDGEALEWLRRAYELNR